MIAEVHRAELIQPMNHGESAGAGGRRDHLFESSAQSYAIAALTRGPLINPSTIHLGTIKSLVRRGMVDVEVHADSRGHRSIPVYRLTEYGRSVAGRSTAVRSWLDEWGASLPKELRRDER